MTGAFLASLAGSATTGALPGQHAVGVDFVEQVMATEITEHVTLDDVLELVGVLGRESGGLMETGLPVDGP